MCLGASLVDLSSGFFSNLALFKCSILSYSLSLLFEPNKYLLLLLLPLWTLLWKKQRSVKDVMLLSYEQH